MFEIFPDNYVWNLSVNIAISSGGHITEIEEACREVMEASREGDDNGTEAFFDAWCRVADRLVGQAEADEAAGHPFSAAHKLRRAAVYYMICERMQSRHYAPRAEAYQKMLSSFSKYIELGQENCERVEIPFEGTTIPALLTRARGVDGPAPTMIFLNGLDSVKEMIFTSGAPTEFARRGISTLALDQPGVGEPLRLQGLHGMHESERYVSACVDYLETLAEVDNSRIGVIGWSLGGYYAPRAAAFEKRLALCVAWGANYNWGQLQERRMAREGDRPVPHYWDHVMWVFGQDTLDEFMAWAPAMSLEGVTEQITVPFLTTHGSNDRQIPREYAELQYETAINSPKRELKWFTGDIGGVEHCSADNMQPAMDYIADWIADTI